MKLRSVFTCLAPLLSLWLSTACIMAGDVEFERDVVYSSPQGEHLQLNLARPKQIDGLAPAVVCIHGGGWAAGSREGWNEGCKRLAERGFVAVTLSYRFAPKFPYPAAIEDVKAGVRWLRANAERLKIDPNRIGAVGDSAGGHLAMMLGSSGVTRRFDTAGENLDRTSAVQCVVNIYGPADMTRMAEVKAATGPLTGFLGDAQQQRERYILASPIAWVTPDSPPMLMIHGTKDDIVPLEQSQRMHDRLQAAGVPCEMLILEGAGHGFKGDDAQRSSDAMTAHFEKYLMPPK